MAKNRINLLRSVFSILTSNIALVTVSVVTTPILTRLLGSSSYGEFATVIAIFSLLKIVTDAGVFNGVRKFIAEDRDVPDWDKKVLSFYFLFSLIATASILLLLGFAGVANVFNDIFGEIGNRYLLLIAAMLVSIQFFGLFRGALMGIGRDHFSEPLNVVNQLLFSVIAILLILSGYGVVGALTAKIVSFATVSVTGLIVLSRFINLRKTTVTGFTVLRDDTLSRGMVSFGIYSILLSLLISSLYNTDIILLRYFVGSEQTGYYKAALVTAEFVWFVPMAVQYSLVHSTSEMWKKEQYGRISQLSSKITRYTLLLASLLSIGLLVLGDVFVPLYFGEEYQSATLPLLLLLPGAIGFSVARPILAIGQGKGELRMLIIATLLSAIINIILNVVLIPPFGMIGAAVATSIGYGSMAIFHHMCALKIGYNPLSDLRPGKVLFTTLVTAAIIFAIDVLLLSDILSLLIIPPLGLFMYVVLSLKLGTLDEKDKTKIRKRIKGITDTISL